MKTDRYENLPLRVAAYCRVSTDRDDQANSLASQKRYFREYIEGKSHWQLAEIYYDEGISGTQLKHRNGFCRMIADAQKGKLDLILTKEVSRFARNTVDALSCTRELKRIGVGVIFTIDHIDTRESDGELRLTIMASIAQEESRKTSERVKWGQKRQMEAGVVFGRELLGYRIIEGKLVVEEREAELVRDIFSRFAEENKSTHTIAKELNESGHLTKQGNIWSNVAILRVLTNEKYVGDLCQKKTFTPDYLTHEKKVNHGQEEKIYIENHHEGIVSRRLWEKTQTELLHRRQLARCGERCSGKHWCSGKVIDDISGKHYVSRRKRRRDGTIYQAWRCASHSVNELTLQQCAAFCIHLFVPDSRQLQKEIQKELQRAASQGMSSDISQKELDRVKKKRKKAIELALDELITKEDLEYQLSYIEEQEKYLKRQINKPDVPDIETVIRSADRILTASPPSPVLLKEVIERIIVCQDDWLAIYLNGLSSAIRIRFKNCGRGEYYRTEILEFAIENRERQGI